MSEIDRIGRIGKAYWNRLRDTLDGDESAARRELEEPYLPPAVPTQGGAPIQQEAPRDPGHDVGWARRKLGVEEGMDSAEIRKRYQALDRKAKRLIKALEVRMQEKPDEADLDQLTLNEAKKLRADLAKAFQVLTQEDGQVTKRFSALELEQQESKSKAKKSTAAPKPTTKKEPSRTNGEGTKRRFQSLELD